MTGTKDAELMDRIKSYTQRIHDAVGLAIWPEGKAVNAVPSEVATAMVIVASRLLAATIRQNGRLPAPVEEQALQNVANIFAKEIRKTLDHLDDARPPVGAIQ